MKFQTFEQKPEIKVAAWYAEKFPTDVAMAQKIDPEVTFNGIYRCIENGYFSYFAFFADDSVVRERVLSGLAEYYHTSYNDVYHRFCEAVCVDPGCGLVPCFAGGSIDTDNEHGVIIMKHDGTVTEFGRTHEGLNLYYYTPVHPVYTSTPMGVSQIWLKPDRAAELMASNDNPFRYLSQDQQSVVRAYLD